MSISNPHNVSRVNRKVAEKIKSHHVIAKNATDWVSSRVKPSRRVQPGASANSLKAPRKTSRPIDD